MFEIKVGALGYLVHCEQVVQNTLQFVFLHAHDPTFTKHTSITWTALLRMDLLYSNCMYVMATLVYLHDKLFDK